MNRSDPITPRGTSTPIDLVLAIDSLHSGGAEKQLLWMAETLATEGIACAVFELRCTPGNRRLERLITTVANSGVEIHRSAKGETYLHAWARFRRLLRSQPKAVVWTWGYRADILMLLWLGLHRRSWLSSLRFASPDYIRRGRWLTNLCRRRVTRYVANSWANCEMLERECPGVMPICRVVYNAVEELKREPVALPVALPRPFRVHMLGNIDPVRKGYDYALELAERLRAERWPIEIHVAGRLDSGRWLPDEIVRRELGGRMFYDGETDDPIGFLRAGHAYLLTSRTEGTPNSLLEAMSVGLPAVATKVGDLERLAVDGEHLRLVAIGDIAGMQAALAGMIADWPAAVAMGRRGRNWCENMFSAQASKAQLLRVVQEVIRRDL